MKTLKRFLLSLLFTLPLLNPAAAADAVGEQAIPLQIFNTTLELRKGLTRAELKTTLSAIIKDEASVDTNQRLQYDVQLVAESAPVTFVFDFNKKGIVQSVMVDAMMKEQNPAVTTLLAWMAKNAGKPDVKKKGKIIWKSFAGWKIEHAERGSGEDSVYRIELTAKK